MLPAAMCLMVWIGTKNPVSAVSHALEADGQRNRLDPVAADNPVRRHFSSPHVTYVGSHEGCGCGFNSGVLEFEGFLSVADVLPLLEAMNDEERDSFHAEQRSRERLEALITASLREGPVEVYACWAGDENEPSNRVEEVNARWFAEHTAPLSEGVLYTIRAEA